MSELAVERKTKKPRLNWSKKTKRSILGVSMVLPSFLLLLVLVIYPVALSVMESFKSRDGMWTLDNYLYLFTEPHMLNNIKHTLQVTVLSSVFVLTIAYSIAVYLRFNHSWIAKMVGKLYFIPMFIPGVIAIYGFINFYRDNGWIARLIGEGNLPSIIYDMKGLLMINIWFNIPFTTMLLVSAMSSIPNAVIESAKDAGAKKRHLFFQFIFPLTYKTMLVALTFLFMGIVGSFTAPFLIDRNAPQMLGVAMQQHFSSYNEIGQASSMAVFLFLLCSFVGYFYIRSNMKDSTKSY
ncbi:ABC-type spermidine/putrescine transport system, permease component I [Evansella caseinilytica]|uniref:ABC-type spermidine/putrescine transport system, permease component I n=1 Tax=Evansella caseinilytica TaxID=1503961 RepID=A0A1H3ULL4_9BACI|nr:ABC transporter permease subunit [Evansella caseinilytica]SDZ62931.1 ABC-type spermidine/putrescine transport system, permease component I [Evansella caseinilytica]